MTEGVIYRSAAAHICLYTANQNIFHAKCTQALGQIVLEKRAWCVLVPKNIPLPVNVDPFVNLSARGPFNQTASYTIGAVSARGTELPRRLSGLCRPAGINDDNQNALFPHYINTFADAIHHFTGWLPINASPRLGEVILQINDQQRCSILPH